MMAHNRLEIYRKAARYCENQQLVQETLQEITQAESEGQEALRPIDEKIRSIEEVQEHIQKTGMSRPLGERLTTLIGRDTIFEERGLSMESFTQIPSRNGVTASLEISEDHKNILLGGAIVIGLGIIIKIIMMVWNFFKKRKATDTERKDKAKELADIATKALQLEKEFQNSNKELKEAYNEIIKGEAYRDKEESLEAGWSMLLKNIMEGDGQAVTAAEKVMKNIHAYENAAQKSLDAAEYTNAHIEETSKAGNSQSFFENHIEPVFKILPPEDMRNNLSMIQGFIDDLQNLRDQNVPLKREDRLKLLEVVSKDREIIFFKRLENYSPFRSGALAGTNYHDRSERALFGLKKRLEEVERGDWALDKELAKRLKAFTDYYKDAMQAFFKTVAFYTTLSAQWTNFLGRLERYLKSEAGMFKSIKRKFNSEESTKYEELKKLCDEIQKGGGGS